jgi:AraC-like DNA-binding protein
MQEYSHEFAERWVNKPDDFDRKGGIHLVHMGHNIAKLNYSEGPKQRPYYTIHFIFEGQLEFSYGKESVILEKGDMFCKYPHTVYTYRIAPGCTALRMMWVSFGGAQADELMDMAGFLFDNPYRRGALTSEIEIILKQLKKIPTDFGKHHLLEICSLIFQMFGHWIAAEQSSTGTRKPGSAWIQKSLDFMHTCYSERVTVNDIARYVGIHRTHFSRTFTEEMGISPAAYLQKIRLNHAQKLLQTTSLSITEIALSVGYQDLFSFTRAFTRHYNNPPSRMRASG